MLQATYQQTGVLGLRTTPPSSLARSSCTLPVTDQIKTLQHYRTIAALPEILGQQRKDDADYLETCRRKRNTVEYDRAGVVTDQDASELIEFCRELQQEVRNWLSHNFPALMPKENA